MPLRLGALKWGSKVHAAGLAAGREKQAVCNLQWLLKMHQAKLAIPARATTKII